ncbi:MAG: alpha/beta hydrolase [Planctomycetaceae bacterium]
MRVLILAMFCWTSCADPAQAQESKPRPAARSAFETWDRNGDGFVSRLEFPEKLPRSVFDRVDRDRDGRISREEDEAFRLRNRRRKPEDGQRQRRDMALPDGIELQRDVVYASVGKRPLHLDLYRQSQSTRPAPLLIWIHGGGWKSGTKQSPRHALSLLKQGFAVAAVEYRLSGEAVFPAAIEDCKAAVSFLRLNAKSLALDPDRFAAWGSSAGGHLVALLGTTNDVELFNTHPICRRASPKVQAVCNWFGPSDFLRMNDFPGRIDHDSANSPESRFIGGPIQERKEQVARANPIHYASEGDPSMLLMHGDSDQLVPYNQSELLHAALVKKGVDSTLYKVKGGGHGFRGAEDSVGSLQRRVARFFRRTLEIPVERR